MIKPIAFGTIEQALEWHGFPVPTLRQLSFYEWLDSWTAEYRAEWKPIDLAMREGGADWSDGSAAYMRFLYDLRECFCNDICPVQMHYDPETRIMSGLLYVRLPKEPIQLQLLGGN